MNPGRFYMPRMGASFNPIMGASYLSTRGNIGLFGRITNYLRSFNWGELLNGANKTLNVVNQTIPLVRQAGPMFNNMKSMMRIARAFGSETNKRTTVNKNINISSQNINHSYNYTEKQESMVDNNISSNDSYPNFFV
jgi:hypothetical protein